MSTVIEEKWLPEREVAAMTGIAISTLQNDRYLSQGIPYAKIGRSVRYKLEDVRQFMEERRVVWGGES